MEQAGVTVAGAVLDPQPLAPAPRAWQERRRAADAAYLGSGGALARLYQHQQRRSARAPPPATRPPLLGVAGSPSTFNDVLRRDPPSDGIAHAVAGTPLAAASSDPLAQIRDVLRRDPLFPIRALHSWVMANQRQHLTLAEATAAAQGRVRAGDLNGAVLLLRQTARDGARAGAHARGAARRGAARRAALFRPHGDEVAARPAGRRRAAAVAGRLRRRRDGADAERGAARRGAVARLERLTHKKRSQFRFRPQSISKRRGQHFPVT